MREHAMAAMPADGIGPWVSEARAALLGALADRRGEFASRIKTVDCGLDRRERHGVMVPADGPAQLASFDALCSGAAGAPDHVILRGLRLPIRQGFDHYANARPTRALPGVD